MVDKGKNRCYAKSVQSHLILKDRICKGGLFYYAVDKGETKLYNVKQGMPKKQGGNLYV